MVVVVPSSVVVEVVVLAVVEDEEELDPPPPPLVEEVVVAAVVVPQNDEVAVPSVEYPFLGVIVKQYSVPADNPSTGGVRRDRVVKDQVDVVGALLDVLPVDVVIRYSVPAGLLATFRERLSRVVDAAVALGEVDARLRCRS